MSAVTNTKTTRKDVTHLQHQDLANEQGRLVEGYPQLHSEFEASLGYIRQSQKPNRHGTDLSSSLILRSYMVLPGCPDLHTCRQTVKTFPFPWNSCP